MLGAGRGRVGVVVVAAGRVEVDPAPLELGERRRVRCTGLLGGCVAPAAPCLHRRKAGRTPDSQYDFTRRVYPAPRFASVSRPDPFGARASLGAGLPDYWRLTALGDLIDLTRAPVTLK